MKLKDLKANPKNPRKISEEKLEMLKKALAEFGDLGGIVYNRTTKQLLGGHQRGKVLPPESEIVIEKTHKKPTKVGTVAEGYILVDGERFNYREVKWDAAKEKAANIAANKGAGEWDKGLLSEMLMELDTINFDLSLTMFDKKELEDTIVPVQHIPPAGDAEHLPAIQKVAITQKGDLWRLGEHLLLCGDSTMTGDLEKLMEKEKADMVFTDPPYGIGFKYNSHQDSTGDEYMDFCRDWYHNIIQYSDFIVISTGWAYNKFWYSMEPKDCFYWLCKNKRTGGSISHFRKVEPIFIWGKPFKKYDFDFWEQTTQIEEDLKGQHTCPKPVSLIEQIIMGCKPKGIILDVFGGSGTTLIAAEKTGRVSRLIEIDPIYCDLIVRRWETYTGQKAELVQE